MMTDLENDKNLDIITESLRCSHNQTSDQSQKGEDILNVTVSRARKRIVSDQIAVNQELDQDWKSREKAGDKQDHFCLNPRKKSAKLEAE